MKEVATMPDDATPQAQSQTDDSSLENLFDEAEKAAREPSQTYANASHSKAPCDHFRQEAVNTTQIIRKCLDCGWPFCEDCASPLDPKYCKSCLPETNGNLIEEPLKDEEGVIHEGRKMTPSPELRIRLTTTAKSLSEMNPTELRDFVSHYKELVKQAEHAL